MKHQRNFLSSILKFILITAAVLILLLFVSCALFSFYYKDIFLHFFQRDVSVGKVTFDIAKQKLSFTDISWGIPDGENLLTAKEIQITPDLKKILKLQIAFEQVLIDGVKTFVIQNGNNYKLPPFLPERKDSTLNFKIPKISVTFPESLCRTLPYIYEETAKIIDFYRNLILCCRMSGQEHRK